MCFYEMGGGSTCLCACVSYTFGGGAVCLFACLFSKVREKEFIDWVEMWEESEKT